MDMPVSSLAKPKSPDVVWHDGVIGRERRERLNQHSSAVLWFTGYPSAGKSTIARALEKKLYDISIRTFVLDGDNVRHGLCGDLGFSENDREENIRRIGEVAKLFVEAGVIVLAAFVSPFCRDRERARGLLLHGDFVEIYCRCPLAVCEERDPKKLYQRARAGGIKDFTGVSSPYETPVDPELIVDTHILSVEECAEQVFALLTARGIVPARVRGCTPEVERISRVHDM